jgi:hypothetical protein
MKKTLPEIMVQEAPNTGRLMNTAAKNTAVRAAAEALKFTLKTLAAAVGCLPLCWLSAY